MEEMLKQLLEGQKQLFSEVRDLKSDVSTLKSDVAEIRSTMATKQDIEDILIEQQADIKHMLAIVDKKLRKSVKTWSHWPRSPAITKCRSEPCCGVRYKEDLSDLPFLCIIPLL
ncbi:hypothetical protein P22_0525 [Propionispora sp. 2/2-37]|uniref:hypothetical protein n=1 Tax=Propionispora sp. 2/2-37 TaxID=1677858 RepID=UPI0006BB6097|nr:hypothetical protein [Propionispora sp. 2/2-37]CUH94459.1 hypothetical protein P22_0525 [Propionispora sp. 2/2-37]